MKVEPSFSLVLLPGLDGTGILYQPIIAALPANIRPIVVRYPPDQKLTYAQLLPLVLAAIPEIGPFIVMGESFSGPLAVMAAERRSGNLLGVILCATFVRPPIPWIGWAIPLVARPIVFRLSSPSQEAKAILGRYAGKPLAKLFAEANALVRPEVVAFRVREVFKIDVAEQLTNCPVPILYLRASGDCVVPARNARMIRRLKPDVRVVTIISPHGIPQIRPRETAEAITRFAESVGASGLPQLIS